MMKTVSTVVLAAIAAASLSAPAAASYVFDTGTSGPPTRSWTHNSAQSLAGYVTLADAATVESVEGYFEALAATVTVSIVSDAALPSGGTTLFQDSFSHNAFNGFDGLFGKSWDLAAGNYWIVFETTGNTAMWEIGAIPLVNDAVRVRDSWYSASGTLDLGIRIAGEAGAVPEPASWALMIGGFALAGAALRGRRRSAVRFA